MVAHSLLEHHMARLAERLRAIHRSVGVAQQFLRVLVVRAAHRDADARRDEDVASAVDLHRLPEERLHALGHEFDVAGPVDTIEENGELVATQSCEHVAGAEAGRQLVRDRRQQLVSNQVAETVVHQLEAIDVDKQHRIPIVAHSLRTPEHAPELLHEGGAVWQVGQRVMTRRMLEARLGFVTVGHVGL